MSMRGGCKKQSCEVVVSREKFSRKSATSSQQALKYYAAFFFPAARLAAHLCSGIMSTVVTLPGGPSSVWL